MGAKSCISVALFCLLLFSVSSSLLPEPKKLTFGKLNAIKVRTSEELHLALSKAVNSSTISLAEGIYTGQFLLWQNALLLTGQGPKTIIKLPDIKSSSKSNNNKPALTITGNNCTIQNLKLVSTIKNKYQNQTTGIQITGSWTNISHISLDGFASALLVQSSNNSISNLACDSCNVGILISGNYNQINNIEIKKKIKTKKSSTSTDWGIYLLSGRGNKIQECRAKLFGMGFGLRTSSCSLRDSVFRTVYLGGANNTLDNVDAGKLLQISGNCTGGHLIIKTRADKLKNFGRNVTFVKSTFKDFKVKGKSDTSLSGLSRPTILSSFLIYMVCNKIFAQ